MVGRSGLGGERAVVIAIALLAFAVRLAIIAASHGGNDLRMYTYFSRLPLHGVNPFAPPHAGLFPPADSNNPPLEVVVFTGLLALHDSPTMLRLLFALADTAVVLLIGLCFARPWRWRLGFISFYAFNPFVLFAWTAFAEDKTLLFLGICAWLLALERGRDWAGWTVASALAAFKFLGTFAAPVLALHTFRRRGWWVLLPAAVFVAVLLISNLPWFPHSLEAFSRRNIRLALNPPIHASPMLLLARLHIYSPVEAKLFTALGILAVLAGFVARRLDVREAVVFSLFAGYLFLPDDAFNRLLLITLPVILLLRFSWPRLVWLWVISCFSALAAAVATRGVPHWLRGVGGPLHALFAHESTVKHVLWMNLLPAAVVVLYAVERRAGRAPVPAVPAEREAVSSASSKAATAAS